MRIHHTLPHELTINGAVFELRVGNTPAELRAEAKRKKIRIHTRWVLSRQLRGKDDLHGKPYVPHEWVYYEVPQRINDFEVGDVVSYFSPERRITIYGHIVKIDNSRHVLRAHVSHKRFPQFRHFYTVEIGCFALTMVSNVKRKTSVH